MRHIIVVNNPKNWHLDIPGVDIVSAKAYLAESGYSEMKNVKVYNLCKSYKYQTVGYYVSLLASARGHKPFPNVLAIRDLKSQSILRIVSEELDELIQKSLKSIQTDRFTLSIYFGKNLAKKYDRLSKRLFLQFQSPLLRAEFNRKENTWLLKSLQPIASSDVPEEHYTFASEMAQEFFNRKNIGVVKKEYQYDLAILVNPGELLPPSDSKAIQRFVKAAEGLGFYTELITKEDYHRLNEFDALFIRETTNVNHHTFRMAHIAAAEGLIVIDDPESILLCTNKVYLAELLRKHKIPAPATVIMNPDNFEKVPDILGFPCIVKQPDSSFSQGVVKADNMDEYLTEAKKLFEKSELLIAQEFIPTTFDWRIGILNNELLYACRYHMARKHWQIYERSVDGKTHEGSADCVALDQVPKPVLKYALKASKLIGNGLYGVDLKEIDGKVYVIEVNDNPSIDSGNEDFILKDELYKRIIGEILNRIDQKKLRRNK